MRKCILTLWMPLVSISLAFSGQMALAQERAADRYPTQILPNAEKYIVAPVPIISTNQEDEPKAPSKSKGPEPVLSEKKIQAKALFDLAEMLEKQGNQEASARLEEAAEAGNAHANYKLARQFLVGKNGREIDINKAITFYKKAASLGEARAYGDLGMIYLGNGKGLQMSPEDAASVEINPERAFYYVKKGANDIVLDTAWMHGNCPVSVNYLRLKLARMHA
jgi:TPR repeat protein